MDAGPPDPIVPQAAATPSLAERMAAAVRALPARARPGGAARAAGAAGQAGAGAGRAGWAIVALLCTGPLAASAAADWLRHDAAARAAATAQASAPARARAAAHAAAHAELARAARVPGVAATLDALAAALPDDARLVRAARGGDGVVELDIATPDPDRLREALRRTPALARFRNVGQHRDATGMVATFREGGA